MDEPTNHLDLASREILEEALEDFEGTILTVSHDRYFINRLADRILYFDGESLREFHGNYEGYLAFKEQEKTTVQIRKTAGAGGESYKQQKEAAARQRKLKTQLQKTEQEIEELETEQTALAEQLCRPETAADYGLLMSVTAQLDEIKERLAEAMDRWEILSEEMLL